MQLPPYRVPTPTVILEQVWRGVRGFLHRAGTVILAGSVVLWALMAFPTATLSSEQLAEAEATGADVEVVAAAWQLDNSYAASLGRLVEPVFAPLGFDWKINRTRNSHCGHYARCGTGDKYDFSMAPYLHHHQCTPFRFGLDG